MLYVEAFLENGNLINNIDFEGNVANIEDSEGNELELTLENEVSVRVFERLEPSTLNDLIQYAKRKNIFMAHIDCEPDATCNQFPELSFSEALKEGEEFSLSDMYLIENAAWGQLKGKERDITLKQLKKIMED